MWKLLVKRPRGAAQRKPPAEPEVLLFNLGGDVGEQDNVAAAHPDIVARLQRRMADCDAEITREASAPWVQPEAAAIAQ